MGFSKDWIGAVAALFWRNWITLLGASITTASAFLIIAFFVLGITGAIETPYLGILTFLVLPGIFVGGLLLIPLGVWWDHRWRRKVARAGHASDLPPYPVLDFNNPRNRKAAVVVGFLTMANVFIISTASYRGVVFMDSPEFCGQVCHSVMEPEFTAYLDSPHSRVDCVECHIGPGAPWFVRSKLSGAGQLIAVALNTYPRPVPTPVPNLRPSQDTCEHCHWPEKFLGDRVRVKTTFSPDEANTRLNSVLIMHLGGGNSTVPGIHSWHIDPGKKTTYYPLDEARQDIGMVRVEDADGKITTYVKDGAEFDPATIKPEQMRTMDCIDCHNRPTHIYRMPGEAMDKALEDGAITTELPYIKMVGVEALEQVKGETGDVDTIANHIRSYYDEQHPEVAQSKKAQIDGAVQAIQAIYKRNVFPHMKVTWGTYPNNLAHTAFPGCFRCHDDGHTSTDGKTISQDCTVCHSVLAMEEENPSILQELGLQ